MSPFLKALQQLPDPRFLKAMFYTLVTALAMLVAVWIGLYQLVGMIPESWTAELGGWGEVLRWSLWALLFLASWLIYPMLAGIAVSLYLEIVVHAVEDKHYPELPPAREQPISEVILDALRFLGIVIAFNLLALPIYYFVPLGNIIVFVLVNGYLLGWEFYELVAVRRLNRQQIRHLHAKYRQKIILTGVFFALLLLIPLVNLVAPILAAATMVHIFRPMLAEQEKTGLPVQADVR